MNIFKILVTTFLFGLVHNSFSQITDINGDYTPHSPEVSSLGNYIDHPVDLSRGIPSISVPVYTLTEGDLSLPISLSYHSQGVVVSSVSSWVGTGWTLKAGGSISRSVNGIADDWQGDGIITPYYGWYHSPSVLASHDFDMSYVQPYGQFIDTLNNLLGGKYDKGPDVFNYSLPTGYSGKFYFDHNKEIRFLDNHDNLKISVTTGTLGHFQSFEVIDPQGNTFTFSDKEYTANEHSITNLATPFLNHAANAWHLTEISNINGTNKIFFSYVEENYTYFTEAPCNFTATTRMVGESPDISEGTLEALMAFSAAQNNCEGNTPCVETLKIFIKGKRLSQINCLVNGVTIDFNTINRPDVALSGNSGALDDIEVSYPSGKCTKFDFSYYNTVDNSNPGGNNVTRFMLESFQKSSCNNSIIEPPYKFYYNDSVMGSGQAFFPKRNSKAIDHWGYYNGENDNALGNRPNYPTSDVYDQNGDLIRVVKTHNGRESNEEKMLLGALTKIQHPLGVIDTFSFEANRVKDYSYWDSRKVFKLDYNCINNGIVEYYHELTSDQIQHAKYDLKVEGGCSTSGGQGGNGTPQSYPLQLEFLTPYPDYNTIRPAIHITGGSDQIIEDDLFDLLGAHVNPGEPVVFRLTVLNSTQMQGEFKIYFHRKVTSPQAVVGGLRVKNIKQIHDGVISEKSYTYNQLEGTPYASSGRLVQFPTYVGGYFLNTLPTTTLDMIFRGKSHFSLSNVEGRHINYEGVRENFQDGSYKLHYFKPGQDPLPITFNSAYYVSYDYPQPAKGLLDSTKTYNSSGTLVLAESNDYHIYNDVMTINTSEMPFEYVVVPCLDMNASLHWSSYYPALKVSVYNPSTGYAKLWRTKTTIYNEIGQEPLTDISKTAYDSHLNVKTQTKWREIDGNGLLNGEDNTKTENFYLYDGFGYGDNTAVQTFMTNKNIVGTPFKTTKELNGTLVSGNIFSYKLSSGKFVLDNIKGVQQGVFYPMSKVLQTNSRGKATYVKAYKIGSTITNSVLDNNYKRLFWDQDNLVKSELHSDLGIKTTDYDFNTDDMLISVTDNNDQITEYTYDDLYRLQQTSEGKSVGESDFRQWTTVDYNYKLDALGNVVPGSDNEVISTLNFSPSGGIAIPSQVSKVIMDELGRNINVVKKSHLPNGQDAIIKTDQYDVLGQLVSTEELGKGVSTYNFESSNLRRLLVTTSPFGNTTFNYGYNERSFVIDGKTYPAGTLNKQIITDPDGSQIINYNDFLGREVRVTQPVTINGSLTNAITSKVYNAYDQIEKILPPNGNPYLYTYNLRGMLKTKKIPTELSVQHYYYDAFGRQVAKTDANGKTIGVEYDDLGRTIASGEISSLSITDQANHLASVPLGSIDKIHTTSTYKQSTTGSPMSWLENETEVNMLSLSAGAPVYYNTDYTYDNVGRILTTEKENHKGGTELITNHYNNANIIYKKEIDHNIGNTAFAPEISLIKDYTFDNALRLTDTYIQMTGISGTKHVTNLVYNDQLLIAQKNMHETTSSNYLQSVDYQYDESGRLIKINELADVNNENCLNDNYCDIHLGVKINGLYTTIESINYLDETLGETTIPGIIFPFVLNALSKGTLINAIENWLTTSGHAFDEVSITNNLNLIKVTQSNAPVTSIIQSGQVSSAVIANCCGNITSSDLFAEKINYGATGTNIKSTEWSTICNNYSKYSYQYDELKRMTRADYYSKESLGSNWSTAGAGGVYGVRTSYDLLGNITNLRRNGSINNNIALIDNLIYGYNSSTGRLDNVAESSGVNYVNHGQKGSTSFLYDNNGNVITEQSKGITVDYNIFNLPVLITKSTNGDLVENVYSSKQNRLQKNSTINGVQKIKDYIGSFEYVTESGETKLESANFDFGRVTFNNEEGRIEYCIKDHLGTPRVHFTDRDNNDVISKADVLQENHTYPFGLEMNEMGSNTIGTENDYKFNGKELDKELGLDWYNYGARFYDPAIARWHSVDPLAEEFFGWSPYNYVMGNPVSLIDPDGRAPQDIILLIGGAYAGHPYGHVAIGVIDECGVTTVYDFGRYGKVSGTFKEAGEGILRVHNSAESYMIGENATGRTTTVYRFESTEEQDQKLMSYFSKLIGESTNYKVTDKRSRFKLKDDYHATDNNCTTISLDGLAEALPEIAKLLKDPKESKGRGLGFKEKLADKTIGGGSIGVKIFMPADLKKNVDTKNKHKESQEHSKEKEKLKSEREAGKQEARDNAGARAFDQTFRSGN